WIKVNPLQVIVQFIIPGFVDSDIVIEFFDPRNPPITSVDLLSNVRIKRIEIGPRHPFGRRNSVDISYSVYSKIILKPLSGFDSKIANVFPQLKYPNIHLIFQRVRRKWFYDDRLRTGVEGFKIFQT